MWHPKLFFPQALSVFISLSTHFYFLFWASVYISKEQRLL